MRPGIARPSAWGPHWAPEGSPRLSRARCCGLSRPHSRSPTGRLGRIDRSVPARPGLRAVDRRRRESVISRWGSIDHAPGVEPQSAIRERAVQGLNDIARHCLGGAAVVVSHDAVNRQVLAAFDARLGDPGGIPQDNGASTRWSGATADGLFSASTNGPTPNDAANSSLSFQPIDGRAIIWLRPVLAAVASATMPSRLPGHLVVPVDGTVTLRSSATCMVASWHGEQP